MTGALIVHRPREVAGQSRTVIRGFESDTRLPPVPAAQTGVHEHFRFVPALDRDTAAGFQVNGERATRAHRRRESECGIEPPGAIVDDTSSEFVFTLNRLFSEHRTILPLRRLFCFRCRGVECRSGALDWSKRRERQQYEDRNRDRCQSLGARSSDSLTRLIEHRKQPSLELRRARHCNREKTWCAERARRARDFEQVCGVVGSRRTKGDNLVVASALTLCAQPSLDHPRKRMEPVDRANESRQQLDERISARDMRHLVAQNNASVFLVPIESLFRQEDNGSASSPREGRADNRARAKLHFARYTRLGARG